MEGLEKMSGIGYKYQSYEWSGNTIPEKAQKEADDAFIEAGKGNFAASVDLYEKLKTACPEVGFVRNNLGCCLAGLEKFDEAETEFLEAIRIFNANRDKGIRVRGACRRTIQKNLINLYKTILRKKQPVPSTTEPRENLFLCSTGPLKREIRSIARSVKRKGIIFAVSKIPLYLSSRFNNALRWYEKVLALRADEFDRKNNIDTASTVYQSDLRVDNKNQSHAVYYQGSDSLFFHNAISSLRMILGLAREKRWFWHPRILLKK